MDQWIEERAEAARIALRVQGFPTEADLWRLAEWLEETVQLHYEAVPLPSCAHRDDGRAVITLPRKWSRRRLDLALCHELGHALLSVGLGPLLRQTNPGDAKTERLARWWDLADERRAEAFVAAWHLPTALLPEHKEPEDLAEAANVSLELAVKRLLSTRGQVVTLESPPRWSAHWQYHVLAVPHRTSPALWVAKLRNIEPVFNFPVRSEVDATEGARQTTADLWALTAEEFERKYERFRVEPLTPIQLNAQDLYDWSRRAAA